MTTDLSKTPAAPVASRSRALCAALLGTALLAGCGETSDIMGKDGAAPFGGRDIKFQSTYAYFPSDFSVSIVRDTMPQEDVCRLLNMFKSYNPPLLGLPILPYKEQHYALVMTIDSVMAPDEVSFDLKDTGTAGDMRYAAIGEYPLGKNMLPSFSARAGGSVYISALEQYKRVAGHFKLQFQAGETVEEDFDIQACPPSTPSS